MRGTRNERPWLTPGDLLGRLAHRSTAVAVTCAGLLLLAGAPPAGALDFPPIDPTQNGIVVCSINDHDQIAASGDFPWGQCRLAGVGVASGPSAGVSALRLLHDAIDPNEQGYNELTTDVTPAGVVGGTVRLPDTSTPGFMLPPIPFVYSFATGTRTAVDAGPSDTGRIEDASDTAGLVGYVGVDGYTDWSQAHAAAWSDTSAAVATLDDLGFGSKAFAVNAHGLAAGFAQTVAGRFDPFLWDLTAGTATDLVNSLGDFGYAPYLGAQIDAAGHVLFFHEPHSSTIAYDAATGTVRTFTNDLGGDDVYSILTESGVVASEYEGQSWFDPGGHEHVPSTIDLVDLTTGNTSVVRAGDNLVMSDVNDVGQLLFGQKTDDVWHSYLVDPTSGTIELDPGTHKHTALMLNNTGLMVGNDSDTLYQAWAAPVPLPPLPPTLTVTMQADGAHLSWSPPPVAGRRPPTSYDIFRNGVVLATVDGTTTSYIDLDSTATTAAAEATGGTVTYAVTASNGQGTSADATATAALPLTPIGPAVPAAPIVAAPSFTG